MSDILVQTIGLKKYFPTKKGMLHAVDDINISIEKGTTLGVVGESGCGKSTLGRTILRLIEPTEGQILYQSEDIMKFDRKRMRDFRQQMQMIFQDPFSSLNPRMNIGQLIADPIHIAKTMTDKREINEKVHDLMKIVGLDERMINKYPHELDGGRRQRIGVARALALDPGFIVCDEPVSALDVSIQAQILNLLMDLKDEHSLTYMFITHDLSVVKHISDEIVVMYLGQIVEKATTSELFKNPLHPYTKALLAAVPLPKLHQNETERRIITGEVTSPVNPKPGCRFAARCPHCVSECSEKAPQLKEESSRHFVACYKCRQI